MSKQLRISPDLALPMSAVTSTQIVYGGKGMGKTNLGAVILEEMSKAGLRWRLLDPLGVSYGLRHSKDGKGKGVECLILGGVHGDLPIEPTAGAIVADFIVDEDVNVIVDFSRKVSGEMWSVAEKVRFLTDVAMRAFQRQGSLIDGRRRDPFFLMLDEAARFIPQVIPAGRTELAFCVGAWEQLVEEGRNIGIGVGLLTQRSARMNKSVSELADVVFAFRTIGPNSLQAILDWLGDHVEKSRIKQLVEEIRSLDVGRCLVVSPGWLKHEGVVQIRERETFDSSATPRPGERQKKVSGAAAAPDLAKYSARMAETIEKAKAADPRELQKEITRLRGELAKAGKMVAHSFHAPAKGAAPDPAALQSKIDRAVQQSTRELRQALEAAMKFIINVSTANFDVANIDKAELEKVIGAAVERATKIIDERLSTRARDIQKLRSTAEQLVAKLHKLQTAPDDVAVDVAITKNEPYTVSAPRTPPERMSRPAVNVDGNGAIGRTPQRILNALRFLESIDISPATRNQVAGFVRISADTGTFRNYLSSLRAAGLIVDRADGAIELTPEGAAVASDDGLPSSRDDLHQAWLRKVGATPGRMLNVLLDRYPEPISREDLAAAIGISHETGTFRNYLSVLRSPGLLEDVSKSEVRATDMLFPPGLN